MNLQLKQRYHSLVRWIHEGSQPKHLLTEAGEESISVTCLNCGHTFIGNYCPACGQAADTGRLQLKPMIMDFLDDIWSLDNRLVRTLFELMTRPGYMVRNYIVDGKRQGYYKPVSLIFLITAFYILASHLLFGYSGEIDFDESVLDESEIGVFKNIILTIYNVFVWLMENKAWASLISVALSIYPMKWCFGRTALGKSLSMADYFCLLLFMQCQTLFVSFLLLPIQYVMHATPGKSILLDFILVTWLLMQFFQMPWRKTLRLYLLLMLIYMLLAIVTIGIVVLGFYVYYEYSK